MRLWPSHFPSAVELLELQKWSVWTDPDLTREAYALMDSGGAERCGCEHSFELLGLGAHQLTPDRALFVADVQKMPGPAAVLQGNQELVQHHFAKCILGAVAASDDAHRPIAVSGERRLDNGKADGQRTKMKVRQHDGKLL